MSSIRRTLLLTAVVAVAGTAIALGRWQLRRLTARRAHNDVILAAGRLPPLQLPQEFSDGMSIDSGRRLVARGSFAPRDQILLRGRVQNDGPGLQVITPFVIESSGAVLWVLRGFIPSPDAVTPPDSIPAPADGVVTVSGPAFAIPITADGGRPLLHNGVTTWARLDRATLAQRRPGSLGVYLILAGDSAGVGRLAMVPPPVLDNGPHLSYAIQWFGIALAVLSFGAVVLWRDGRERPRLPAAP